jgi:hypothetical protein
MSDQQSQEPNSIEPSTGTSVLFGLLYERDQIDSQVILLTNQLREAKESSSRLTLLAHKAYDGLGGFNTTLPLPYLPLPADLCPQGQGVLAAQASDAIQG